MTTNQPNNAHLIFTCKRELHELSKQLTYMTNNSLYTFEVFCFLLQFTALNL